MSATPTLLDPTAVDNAVAQAIAAQMIEAPTETVTPSRFGNRAESAANSVSVATDLMDLAESLSAGTAAPTAIFKIPGITIVMTGSISDPDDRGMVRTVDPKAAAPSLFADMLRNLGVAGASNVGYYRAMIWTALAKEIPGRIVLDTMPPLSVFFHADGTLRATAGRLDLSGVDPATYDKWMLADFDNAEMPDAMIMSCEDAYSQVQISLAAMNGMTQAWNEFYASTPARLRQGPMFAFGTARDEATHNLAAAITAATNKQPNIMTIRAQQAIEKSSAAPLDV
jgi:hypothetical protein